MSEDHWQSSFRFYFRM